MNNGDNLPTFVSQLDGDLQKDERLTSMGKDKTLSDFVRDSFKTGEELKTLREASEGAIKVPGEKSTDEERKKFTDIVNKYLGVPESIEGYEIQKPDNLPEDMVYDEVLADTMFKVFHEAGVPKTMAQKIVKAYNDYHIDLHNKFNEYIKEGNEKRVQVLKDLWKNNYDAESKKTFLAISKFAEKAGVPEGFGGMEGFKKWISDSGLDTDPIFNWMWNRVFELIGDDTFEKGTWSSGEQEEWRAKYPEHQKK